MPGREVEPAEIERRLGALSGGETWPARVAERVREVLRSLAGGMHPRRLGGRLLKEHDCLWSLRIGYRLRLLVREGAGGFEPSSLLRHGNYDKRWRRR